MYIVYAAASAVFAGLTAVLAKIGVKEMDSTLATAVRTVVVAVFAWLMAWITGAVQGLAGVSARTLVFLVLSGLATGASWLCFYRALQLGDMNSVVPIDKSGTVRTMLLALIFLGEGLTFGKAVCMAAIAAGTLLMIRRAPAAAGEPPKRAAGTVYALLSAVFASLTSLLAKVGIAEIDSNLGTAVRTTVVLITAWAIVFARKKQRELRACDARTLAFLALSGFATGASWLCFYRALQLGPASVVVPIDKLSLLVTVACGCLLFRERLEKRAWLGLGLITAGTVAMAFL